MYCSMPSTVLVSKEKAMTVDEAKRLELCVETKERISTPKFNDEPETGYLEDNPCTSAIAFHIVTKASEHVLQWIQESGVAIPYS